MLKALLLALLCPVLAPVDATTPESIVVVERVNVPLENVRKSDLPLTLTPLSGPALALAAGEDADCGKGGEVVKCGDHTFKKMEVMSGVGSAETPEGAIQVATFGLEMQILVDSGVECDCCDNPEGCQLEMSFLAEAEIVTLTFVPGHINPDGEMVPDTWVCVLSYSGWVEFICTPC